MMPFLTEVLLSEAKILAGEKRSSWLSTSPGGGVLPNKSDNNKLHNWHCKKITFEHILLKDFWKVLS